MSKKPITVGDIRRAIRNLPNDAPVIFDDPAFTNDREVSGIGPIPVEDGRYGKSLMFKVGTFWFGGQEGVVFHIGDMAVKWGEQNYTEIERDQDVLDNYLEVPADEQPHVEHPCDEFLEQYLQRLEDKWTKS